MLILEGTILRYTISEIIIHFLKEDYLALGYDKVNLVFIMLKICFYNLLLSSLK
jgi:hypothetical protein